MEKDIIIKNLEKDVEHLKNAIWGMGYIPKKERGRWSFKQTESMYTKTKYKLETGESWPTEPEDFVFSFIEDDPEYAVLIWPKHYWEQNACVYGTEELDEKLPFLSKHWKRDTESCYVYLTLAPRICEEEKHEEIRKELVGLGLTEVNTNLPM